VIGIFFSGLFIAGVIRNFMAKQKVAIWSADRKTTQGKQPNIISKTFGSAKQTGKTNTFSVGPTIGPQNPGSK
jgi:hypothetical protein